MYTFSHPVTVVYHKTFVVHKGVSRLKCCILMWKLL